MDNVQARKIGFALGMFKQAESSWGDDIYNIATDMPVGIAGSLYNMFQGNTAQESLAKTFEDTLKNKTNYIGAATRAQAYATDPFMRQYYNQKMYGSLLKDIMPNFMKSMNPSELMGRSQYGSQWDTMSEVSRQALQRKAEKPTTGFELPYGRNLKDYSKPMWTGKYDPPSMQTRIKKLELEQRKAKAEAYLAADKPAT